MPTNKLTIPEIRERLYEIAEEEDLPELIELADQTFRNTAVRRAPISSAPMTPELAEEIRDYADQNPEMHLSVIAAKFNVNPGRVSEAMNE